MKRAVSLGALVVLASVGLFNGTALVSNPTGASIGLRVDMLPSWHTWDYRLSGLFVLLFLGCAPLICAAAVVFGANGAATAAAGIGAICIGWVIWQVVVLQVVAPIAQAGLSLVGIVLVVSGMAGRLRDAVK